MNYTAKEKAIEEIENFQRDVNSKVKYLEIMEDIGIEVYDLK